MTALTLRRAIPADAAALAALHVASWRETYTGLVPNEILEELSVAERTAMWGRILDVPDESGCAAVLIVEDGARAIGFGSCGRQRDDSLADAGFSGEFGAIYVLRSHQGRNVGKSIMAAMSKALSVAGHAAASLWVLRRNAPARGFYERLGGVVVASRTNEGPDPALAEDAYGWRDLSSLSR